MTEPYDPERVRGIKRIGFGALALFIVAILAMSFWEPTLSGGSGLRSSSSSSS
jgi:hypothetical protein